MRISKVCLSFAAATLLIAGCAKKEEPATQAVASAEAAVAAVRDDAAKYAPEALQSVDAKLAEMKDELAKEKYKAVLLDAPKLNAEVNLLTESLIAKKTQIQASTNEWTDLKAEVPLLVSAIQNRLDSLSVSGKLPESVPKAAFEAAQAGLAGMKSMWAEATAAFSAGNATEAADKGRLVKAKAAELQQQLAMPVA